MIFELLKNKKNPFCLDNSKITIADSFSLSIKRKNNQYKTHFLKLNLALTHT